MIARARPHLITDAVAPSSSSSSRSVEASFECDVAAKSVKVQATCTSVRGNSLPDEVFTFDGVLNGAATQDDVFQEVQDIVQAAVDGQEACIFAYGQTGSGKTYTVCDVLQFQNDSACFG